MTHDLRAVVSGRINLLLEGRTADIERCVRKLLSQLPEPVYTFPGSAPAPVEEATLLVREVTCLSPEDKQRLLSLLNGNHRELQVISTSSRQVFPLVEQGEFPESLYYRLNVVRLQVEAETDVHP